MVDLITVIKALGGIVVLLAIAFVFSVHKKHINWRTVFIGIGLQLLLALLLLKAPYVNQGFQVVASGFVKLLSFTKEGSAFLFGDLVTNTQSYGFIFAFQVLPTVLFFSALTALLFYLGILQKVVQAFAFVMTKTMGLTGAESLAASANIFIGQTEAPLLIKPYLKKQIALGLWLSR